MSDSLNNKLARQVAGRDGEKQASVERYQASSRKRLMKILKKKVTTSFIGSLSVFEKYFGDLWGHGLDRSELTPEQLQWRNLWDEARTELLNNGNNQLRAVENEVGQYTVSWHSFVKVFPVVPQQPDRV